MRRRQGVFSGEQAASSARCKTHLFAAASSSCSLLPGLGTLDVWSCTPHVAYSLEVSCMVHTPQDGCHQQKGRACCPPTCLTVILDASHRGAQMSRCVRSLVSECSLALQQSWCQHCLRQSPFFACSWRGSLSPEGADIPRCRAVEGSRKSLSGRLKRQPRLSCCCASAVRVSACDLRMFASNSRVKHLQSARLHGLPA